MIIDFQSQCFIHRCATTVAVSGTPHTLPCTHPHILPCICPHTLPCTLACMHMTLIACMHMTLVACTHTMLVACIHTRWRRPTDEHRLARLKAKYPVKSTIFQEVQGWATGKNAELTDVLGVLVHCAEFATLYCDLHHTMAGIINHPMPKTVGALESAVSHHEEAVSELGRQVQP